MSHAPAAESSMHVTAHALLLLLQVLGGEDKGLQAQALVQAEEEAGKALDRKKKKVSNGQAVQLAAFPFAR